MSYFSLFLDKGRNINVQREKQFEFIGNPSENAQKFHDSFVRFNQVIPTDRMSHYFEVFIKEEPIKPRLEEFNQKEDLQIVVGVSTKELNENGNGTFFWLNPEREGKESGSEFDFTSLRRGDILTCYTRKTKNGSYCRLWKNGSCFGPYRFISHEKPLYPAIGLNTNKVLVEVNLGKADIGMVSLLIRLQSDI